MTPTLSPRVDEALRRSKVGKVRRRRQQGNVSESVVVGFLGGLSGILMGVTLGVTVNIFLNIVAGQFGGQDVRLFCFPLDFLAFIAIFSACVGYLTGIFPARRASTLNPLDAIRYE